MKMVGNIGSSFPIYKNVDPLKIYLLNIRMITCLQVAVTPTRFVWEVSKRNAESGYRNTHPVGSLFYFKLLRLFFLEDSALSFFVFMPSRLMKILTKQAYIQATVVKLSYFCLESFDFSQCGRVHEMQTFSKKKSVWNIKQTYACVVLQQASQITKECDL